MEIAGRKIGEGHAPYVIAEISGNHAGSLELAKRLVQEAKWSGADAVKLQTYTAEMMTLPGLHVVDSPDSPWHGKDLFSLYQEAHTPLEWHQELFALARELDIVMFSSPFSIESVDLLESLDAPAYKVASFENRDYRLLDKVASTGKPIILSTGATPYHEVAQSVEFLRSRGCEDLVVMACVSAYPAPVDSFDLSSIRALASLLECPIGLSDHSLGVEVAVKAVSHGACVVEKHLALEGVDSVDSSFSMRPSEFRIMVDTLGLVQKVRGGESSATESPIEEMTLYKRGLYWAKDLEAGEEVGSDAMTTYRPRLGVCASEFYNIQGKVLSRSVSQGQPIYFEDIS